MTHIIVILLSEKNKRYQLGISLFKHTCILLADFYPLFFQFNRRVTSVRRVESEVTGAQWQVQVEDVQRKVFDPPQLFDAVVVCNGYNLEILI